MINLTPQEKINIYKHHSLLNSHDRFAYSKSESEEKGKAQLAWKFHFAQKDTSNCWYYAIDAHTGEIIIKLDTIRDWALSGNVEGDIYPTDGDDSTTSRDLENLAVEVQRYYYGWISSGYDYTNNSGNYSISYPSYYLYHRVLAGTVGEYQGALHSSLA